MKRSERQTTVDVHTALSASTLIRTGLLFEGQQGGTAECGSRRCRRDLQKDPPSVQAQGGSFSVPCPSFFLVFVLFSFTGWRAKGYVRKEHRLYVGGEIAYIESVRRVLIRLCLPAPSFKQVYFFVGQQRGTAECGSRRFL